MKYSPGDTVLIRGVVGRNGVVLAPGVEIGQASLDIVADVPRFDPLDEPAAMILFFEEERDKRRFAQRFARALDTDVIDVRVFGGAG